MGRYEGSEMAQFRRLTINQIQLLNHASTVNHERSDEYYEWKKQFEDEDGKPGKTNVKVKTAALNDLTEMPSEMAMKMMIPRF